MAFSAEGGGRFWLQLSHLSPLHGTIYMNLRCLMEASVEERGFLVSFAQMNSYTDNVKHQGCLYAHQNLLFDHRLYVEANGNM